MNNIYKHKAEKYKYKYLKLKQEYIGGGQELKFIGLGGFGCIISPPVQFIPSDIRNIDINELNNIKQITQFFPENNTTIDEKIYNSTEYVGKLLSYDSLMEEKKEYDEINKIDEEGKYRCKLIYAASMTKKALKYAIDVIKKKDVEILKLNDCLIQKGLIYNANQNNLNNKYHTVYPEGYINKDNNIDKYGYLIITKVGTSFDKLNNCFDNSRIDSIKLKYCSKTEIIQILTNLKGSIKDLITKLYTKDMYHGDLKSENITLDKNFNIYYIDFGLVNENTNYFNTLSYSLNYNYPPIFLLLNFTFDSNKKIYNNKKMTKSEFIANLNNKYSTKLNDVVRHLLLSTKLNFIDCNCFFHSWKDNESYFPSEIYTNFIVPIAKNIDIYALSYFIFFLFNKETMRMLPHYQNHSFFNLDFEKCKQINAITKTLLINAIYNNIDGPEELIIYLDGIINCLNNNYESGSITTNIYKRRLNPENKDNIKPYINFFEKGYAKEYSEIGEPVITPYDNPQYYQPQAQYYQQQAQQPQAQYYPQAQQPQAQYYQQQQQPQQPQAQAQGYQQAPAPRAQGYQQAPAPRAQGYQQVPAPRAQGYQQVPAPRAQGYPQAPAPRAQGYPQAPAPRAQGYPQAQRDQRPQAQGYNYW